MQVKEPLPGPHTPEAVVDTNAGGGNPSRLCARGEAADQCVASCTYGECPTAIRLPTPQPVDDAVHLHAFQLDLAPSPRSEPFRPHAVRVPASKPPCHTLQRRGPPAVDDDPIPRVGSICTACIAICSRGNLAIGSAPACAASRGAGAASLPRRVAADRKTPNDVRDASHRKPCPYISINTASANLMPSAPSKSRNARPADTMQ